MTRKGFFSSLMATIASAVGIKAKPFPLSMRKDHIARLEEKHASKLVLELWDPTGAEAPLLFFANGHVEGAGARTLTINRYPSLVNQAVWAERIANEDRRDIVESRREQISAIGACVALSA